MGVGAWARAVPVACHMPDGGLDSRNRIEALRRRPVLVVEDLVREGESVVFSPLLEYDVPGGEGAPAPVF